MPVCKNKDCKKPKKYIHSFDKHEYCLWCLGPDHDPKSCSLCLSMAPKNQKLRENARQQFIATGVWPKTLGEKTKPAASTKSAPSSSKVASSPQSSQSTVVYDVSKTVPRVPSPRPVPVVVPGTPEVVHHQVQVEVHSIPQASQPDVLTCRTVPSSLKHPRSVASLPVKGPRAKRPRICKSQMAKDRDLIRKHVPSVKVFKSAAIDHLAHLQSESSKPVSQSPSTSFQDTLIQRPQGLSPDSRIIPPVNAEDEIDLGQSLHGFSAEESSSEDSEHSKDSSSSSEEETGDTTSESSSSQSIHELVSETTPTVVTQPTLTPIAAVETTRAQTPSAQPILDLNKFREALMQGVVDHVTNENAKFEDRILKLISEKFPSHSEGSSQPIDTHVHIAPAVPSTPVSQPPLAPKGFIQTSQVHTSEVTQDRSSQYLSDTDYDSSSETSSRLKSKQRKKRHEDRIKWIKTVCNTLSDRVPQPEVQEDKDDARWLFNEQPKPKKPLHFPIHKGVSSQLKAKSDLFFKKLKSNKPSSKPRSKKFDPVKVYSQAYSTSDPDEYNFSHPHAVPPILVNEIPDPKVLACANPTVEARLPSGSTGNSEKALIDQQLFAQTSFRISNAMFLGLQTLNILTSGLRHQSAQFRSETPLSAGSSVEDINVREQRMSQFASSVAQTTSMLVEGLNDVNRCGADLFNMQAQNYIDSTKKRRKLWLDQTTLPTTIISEIDKMPISVVEAGSSSPPDLLGNEAALRVKDEQAARKVRKDQAFVDLATAQATSSFKIPKIPEKKRKRKKGKKSKDHTPQTHTQSPLPQTTSQMNFQSEASPRGRGGGRGRGSFRGGRGQNKARRGGGRPQ